MGIERKKQKGRCKEKQIALKRKTNIVAKANSIAIKCKIVSQSKKMQYKKNSIQENKKQKKSKPNARKSLESLCAKIDMGILQIFRWDK